MAKLTLSDLTQLSSSESTAVATINANQDAVETAMENTLSRDGTSPNTMEADFDMNGNRILNLVAAVSAAEPVRKSEFDAAVAGITGNTGVEYLFAASTTMADPGAGYFRMNNATPASVTALAIDDTSNDSGNPDISAWLTSWDDSDSTIKGYLRLYNEGANEEFAIFQVDSLTDNTGWVQVTVTYVTGSGTWTADDIIRMDFYRTGDKGTTGISAGLKYTFNATTTMADPGAGLIRLNNATLASVTAIAIDDTTADSGNPDASAYIITWDDSDSTVKGYLFLVDESNPEVFAIYQVDSLTDNSGWSQLGVTHVASSGTFAGALRAVFYRTGDKGATGATGPAGQDGGIVWTWDTNTATSDPGTGDIKVNNASLASATELYINDGSAETGNPDMSTWLAFWDDSGSTVKGYVMLKKASAPENFAMYSVSSATDNTGWWTMGVTYISHSGSFSAADNIIVEFVRNGDPGSASNSFETITPNAGASVVADSATDTLTFTSTSSHLTMTGTAATDTIDFAINLTTAYIWTAAHTWTTAGLFQISDAATTTAVNSLTFKHTTSGTAGTGFGVFNQYMLENASGSNVVAGIMQVEWTDATAASEDAKLVLKLMRAGSSTTQFQVDSLGDVYAQGNNLYINNENAAVNAIANFRDQANTAWRKIYWDNTNGYFAFDDSGGTAHVLGGLGQQSIWIPAKAMQSRTTNGAASGSAETTTNKVMLDTLDFDTATDEFAQFDIRMPKSWNESTVTFIPVWSHPSTATNFGVSWWLQGVALSDGDAADSAFGTAVESQDTGGTTDDIYQGPESSAITIAGTPATGDWVKFQIYRDVSDAGDTLAVDARLHGILLLYTIADTRDN